MSVLSWILVIVLTLVFLAAGGIKLSQPKDALRQRMPWVEGFTPMQVKAIGGVELLGALGLILPAVTKTATGLTTLAAFGLALTMVGAVLTHLRLKDPVSAMVPAAVLGVLSLVLAISRL